MSCSLFFHAVGYAIGLLGISFLIWSLFKQGVSFLGVSLLTGGFFLVAVCELILQYVFSGVS